MVRLSKETVGLYIRDERERILVESLVEDMTKLSRYLDFNIVIWYYNDSSDDVNEFCPEGKYKILKEDKEGCLLDSMTIELTPNELDCACHGIVALWEAMNPDKEI
jgi:hypothetical protein